MALAIDSRGEERDDDGRITRVYAVAFDERRDGSYGVRVPALGDRAMLVYSVLDGLAVAQAFADDALRAAVAAGEPVPDSDAAQALRVNGGGFVSVTIAAGTHDENGR